MQKPELLAPVQDWNTLKSFNIDGLPDAIYFGVKNFNMREKAVNFNKNDLREIVKYCNDQEPKIKTYLTTNIIIYTEELEELENLILEAKNAGIDAIIVHDLAAIKIALRNSMPFHISTQSNISNIESARFFEDLGAKRIVLARELSLKQIKKIKKGLNKCELECFIHGAMCTSISGRCYLSATICESTEFSANRGRCVQPCRRNWRVIDDDNHELLYDGQRFLNSKDLCMIEYIPELIDSGIDSFKIEGRMKDPIYVREVTQCYREAIVSHQDGSFSKDKVRYWLERLSKVFNRGFHTGFYFRKPTIQEIELQIEGNVSPYRKKYVGKVLTFNDSSKTANILIENKNIPLRIGSEIILQGADIFRFETVKKIFIHGEKVKSIMRTDKDAPLKINARLAEGARPEDKIFVLIKEDFMV
ncbi:MAG: peptidase U32 family protein [Promethearchaeota archaeon]